MRVKRREKEKKGCVEWGLRPLILIVSGIICDMTFTAASYDSSDKTEA